MWRKILKNFAKFWKLAPDRVALHPFSAHYYITSSNNDGRKQKHTTHYLQCFNSDGRRRNETGSPQTDQSMSNRVRHEGNSNGQCATRAAMRQGRRSGERRRWLTGRLLLLMQIDGEIWARADPMAPRIAPVLVMARKIWWLAIQEGFWWHLPWISGPASAHRQRLRLR